MIFKFFSLVTAIILFSISFLSAQENNSGSIKGIIVENGSGKPVEFVNVVVRKISDSTIVTGKATDKTGTFEFSSIPDGEYFMSYSQVGFKEKKSPAFVIEPRRKHLNLGRVALVATEVSLDEILVTGEKSLMNAQIDRKVYNVDQDLMSKAASATELLQNVPSVEVDMDGNVSLRGSSSVMIMLNGRSSLLMNKSSATVLQQLPASSIERIEVITNPSAKYKPDGSSGIINIVLKKESEPGINGSVTGNAGVADRYNGNTRLNYRFDGINLYASYGIRKDSRSRYNTDSRRQLDTANLLSFYHEQLNSSARPLSHIVSLGAEYSMDDENQFGVSGNYVYNSFRRIEATDKFLFNSINILTNQYRRGRIDDEYEKEFGGTAFFEHAFENEDHTLRLEFNTEQSSEQEDNRYTDTYQLPAFPVSYDNMLIKNGGKKNELIAEYKNPLNGKAALEAGYSAEFIRNDFDFFGNYFDVSQQRFIVDTTRTNSFTYDEAIHSLYATFKQSFGPFGVLAGLRGEFVSTKFDLATLHLNSTQTYTNLYPTLHTSYKLDPSAELQFSYSRRTRRPDDEDLNPFPEYRDPRNVTAGNPNLRPEYVHLAEFGFQYQNNVITVLPAFFYRYTYNRFTSVTIPINDSTLLTTRENLSNDRAAGLELVVSGNIGNVLTVNGNANAYRNQIDASNLGYGSQRSITTWGGRLTVDVNLSGTTRWQVNSNYSSSRLTPQGEQSASYVVNTGLRQEFFEGKFSVILTVADIFKTQKREYELNIPSLHQNVVNTRDARIIYLGFTYLFGTQSKRSTEEQMRYDDSL